MQSTGKNSTSDQLFLVGVGASAGGLDALTKFLGSFNGTETEISVVVAMHLSPEHRSELSAILEKRCKWPVVTIEEKQELKPRHIFVTPQNRNVLVKEDFLVLEPLPEDHITSPSIDTFLNSLAINKKKRAVGVILSGHGNDGSKGIVAVKEQNGFTIAQLPESAEQRDMPQNAIETQAVDAILPAEEIFGAIVKFVNNGRNNESQHFVYSRIRELEEELAQCKERLQILTKELQATNNELKISKEQLQLFNEELILANVELESGNEELQSFNEELHTADNDTANNDLRNINDALIQKEKDLEAAQISIEHNELLYRTIAENIPNGTVGILNSNFEIEFVAGSTLKGVHGLKSEELIGKNLPDMNPSARERRKLKRTFENTLKGRVGNIEFSYNDRYYALQTVPLQLPNSNEHKILYLTQDQTRERLNELKFKMAVEASSLIIYEYNYKTDTLSPNEDLLNLFEVPKGMPFKRLDMLDKFHPEDLARLEDFRRDIQSTGKINMEVRIVVSSGIKWIRVTGRVIYDTQNNPDYAVAALLDITEDKLQLQRLQEREERFRSIADSAPVKIWVADARGMKTYFNKNWFDFSGRSLEEDCDMGWLDLVHPQDLALCRATYENAIETGQGYTMEYRAINSHAEYRWILDSGLPVRNARGEMEGFIGSCIDVTNQKEFSIRMESQVNERTIQLSQSNKKLQVLNESLEEYAHAASHDLQEPLRKIETFASIIKEHADEPEKMKRYIDKIDSSARRMRRLVQDILAYNELSGQESIDEPVDMDKLMREIEKDFELILKEKKAKLITGKLGKVGGNKVQLYQLLSNLVKNALTYNEGKPRIEVRITQMPAKKISDRFPAVAGGIYHRLTVQDNGIGFDVQHMDKLIKPFGRLHGRSEYPGSGIGLATCKRIIDLHNGFLEAESSIGLGSVFIIYLPKKEI